MKRRNIFKSSSSSDKDVFLPSLSTGVGSGGRRHHIDGSGRGVQMDAPIIRNWKNASGYTRSSYMWLLGSLVCLLFSYKYVMYHYATTFLECTQQNQCTLKIIPPGRGKSLTLKFHKDQMLSTRQISVTSNGEYNNMDQEYNTSRRHQGEEYESYGLILVQDGKEMFELHELENRIRNEQREEEKKMIRRQEKDLQEEERQEIKSIESKLWKDMVNKGLISNEQLKSMEQYGTSAALADTALLEKFERQKELLMKEIRREKSDKGRTRDDMHKANEYLQKLQKTHEEKRRMIEEKIRRDGDYPRLDDLYQWVEVLGDGHYMVVMRKYNIGHRRRRVTALMRSITYYMEGKKDRVTIRENRNVAWQGILGLVFGMFSFLLCILVGQFWEPVEKKSYRTPAGSHANAVRRKHVNHLTAQGPPHVPKHFPSSSSNSTTRMRQQAGRPKAYGGYVPSYSAY